MPVYIIRAGTEGPVKIGWSKRPAIRKANVQPTHYEELFVLREINCTRAGEGMLHRYFQSRRIRGEWFTFDEEMLSVEIESVAQALHARSVDSLREPPPSGMNKAELREWIDRRRITQAQAATLLGLSLPTLVRQITDAPSGVPVSRQTAIICRLLDRPSSQQP
jgi:hypothetical protein